MIDFVTGQRRLGYGLGQTLEKLAILGLQPSETAVDLAVLATAVTAADTRISRDLDAQDAWTRQIDLHIPVQDCGRWTGLSPLLSTTLNFLTGDRWNIYFRPRPSGFTSIASGPTQLRLFEPSSVCLFSGGLDSFIGAIDLLARGQTPLLISHYWDRVTSSHQKTCSVALSRHFRKGSFGQVRAYIGFPKKTFEGSTIEETQRARSFLFFSLAAMAADATGEEMIIHVPENGLISLNVPLDPLRVGALSTRTTHPYYMARFGEIIRGLGIRAELVNPYAFMTKGQMAANCADLAFLRREARKTMSCSSPGNRRFDPDPEERHQRHCGRCVPCLIRRAAIRMALGRDKTPYRVRNLRHHVLDTNKAEGKDVRSFQLALSRLADNPGRARFDIHRPGPLTDHPQRLADYEAVYVAGLQEVGELLRRVRAAPL
ncbi:Qat anti-phage system QueC-like protein QatC [Cupriavidus sp. amp6]|uniref:Qat anti-phage system QueC-like protein QatC n=1 Tax=Cupriavidus sp. amp6 TaxID=388051 RepID=UPI0018DC7BCA|nr:Qat anti-phage system QueC-like protein QatC [Cupriavidus sp. amp6]